MGLSESLWDNCSFTLKGYIACGNVACANWIMARLYHIGAMVHIPTDLVIDTALIVDLDTELLGAF